MTMTWILQASLWEHATATGERTLEFARRAGVIVLVAAALIVGAWLAAAIAAAVSRALLRLVHFDEGVQRLIGEPGAIRLQPSRAVTAAVRGSVWLLVALFGSELLGLTLASSVGARLEEVVPRIITSAVLLGMGTLLALTLGAMLRHLLDRAGVRAARFQGQVATLTLMVFSILLALDQLGFAAQFVMALGVIAVGAAGLGLALAFGLGCRELARDFLVEYLRALEDSEPRPPR
jgi:small-conductance mechanosensitive channel